MADLHPDSYRLLVLDEGSVRYDGHRHHGPCAFLLPPGTPFRIGADARFWLLVFDVMHQPRRRVDDGPAWRHDPMQAQPSPAAIWGWNPPVDIVGIDAVRRVAARCANLWWKGPRQHARANHLLTGWLLDHCLPGQAEEIPAHRWLRRLEQLARERLGDGLDAQGLAALLGWHRSTLTRRLQSETGGGAEHFLAGLRAEQAEALLRQSDLPLAVVARRAGYPSPARFAQAWKERTGMTPRDWRSGTRLE